MTFPLRLENPLRAKMTRQELAVGMIVRLVRGVEIVAIARMAGFDVLFIDLEHNGFTHETAMQLCLAANMAGITPLVRVGRCDASEIGRALDTGAMGVIVPGIESEADARLAVRATRYPPLGERSVMPCLPQLNFAPAPIPAAMSAVNEAVMIVAKEAVEIANASVYGLGGYVFAGDRRRGYEVASRLRAGRICFNGAATDSLTPMGGYKQSGIGRSMGVFGLEEYLEPKSVYGFADEADLLPELSH